MTDDAPLPPFPTAPAADAWPLVERLCRLIDDDLVGEIAVLDNGIDVDQNILAIRRACSPATRPARLGWNPREVLELASWWEPAAHPPRSPRWTGATGHMMRAFACALLMADLALNDDGDHHREADILIRLVRSLTAFEPSLAAEASALLALRLDQHRRAGRHRAVLACCTGLAILFLILSGREPVASETVVAACLWLAQAEDLGRQALWPKGGAPDAWLAGLLDRSIAYPWAELGLDLAALDRTDLSGEASDWVRTIGVALSGGDAAKIRDHLDVEAFIRGDYPRPG